MRNVVAHLEVSLDGVAEAPERWAHAYTIDEMVDSVGTPDAGTVLFGRKTYEEFSAFWPHQDPKVVPFAGFLNESLKIVASNTMTEPSWGPAEVVSGDIEQAVQDLKRKPGQDVLVLGSLSIVTLLLRARLLDSVELFVYPVLLGRGRRWFENADKVELTLKESLSFSNGVLRLRYEPA